MRFWIFLFLFTMVCPASDKELFSFTKELPNTGELIQTNELTPTDSKWATGLREKNVFHRQLSCGNWSLRIGKGGQIYSLRGPFGEAMPPQRPGKSEWNDEVWQLVSVSSAKNDAHLVDLNGKKTRPLAYFIHGSGIYLQDPKQKKNFYNPLLAEYADKSSYACLNWGQHAHVPSIHRSSALYYTKFTADKKNGLCIDYTIHNFGDDVLNYFNTPWGGVRYSTFPVHVLSKPDGSFAPTPFIPFNHKGVLNATKTGGWCGFFTDNSPDAWGMALVFGRSEKVRYRWGHAGRKPNARDYFVSVVNPRLEVKKGETLRVRIYMIVDRMKNMRKRCEEVLERTICRNEEIGESPQSKGLNTWPQIGSEPIFLLQNTATGKKQLTKDPYLFSSRDDMRKYYPNYKGTSPVLRPYDGRTRYLKLMGFKPAESGSGLEALSQLKQAPILRDTKGEKTKVGPGVLKRVYYDALDYEGRPTRVFAWIGIPAKASTEKPVPGIVLVHGGGGTAFKAWVEKWNARGFAAISIAVEGQTDKRVRKKKGAFHKWLKHQWPGPQRIGIYGDSDKELKDQWMYHAVADSILANSLLRSLPQVDADKVGIMGISWGGIITSTVIGLDKRFAFAIPVYGCGNLAQSANQYGRALGKNEMYQKIWDPLLRLNEVETPTLWLSWPGDKHFPLDKQAVNYKSMPAAYMVSLIPGMKHSHDAAWKVPDSYTFAESVIAGGKPWARQMLTKRNGKLFTVSFATSKPLDRAVLISTTDNGVTGERQWQESPATIKKSGDFWQVTAELPLDTTSYFMNARSGELTISSDFMDAK